MPARRAFAGPVLRETKEDTNYRNIKRPTLIIAG
jgi:hypothetical protein